MKAHNRTRIAYIKWTAIIFLPVILLLVVFLIADRFERTRPFAQRCYRSIYAMFEHRAYRTRVAHRGYELILKR